jgi:predicted SAM-dependent methyltransferase
VVELGSLSINSNVKEIFDNKFKYTGLDIEKGPNVDLVLDDPYKLPFENNSIDVVISISTFEHTDFFWLSYL